MTKINWQQAEEILGTGMSMELIDGKWCMMRDGVRYYDAPTKEMLIEAYFYDDMEDFEYEVVEKIYPETLINIHLPKEPATCNRSYCLRQLSGTQWATSYYNEDEDAFYYVHIFNTYTEASIIFREELNKQMNRYSYFTEMFFKYRSYIVSQEAKSSIKD